MDALELADFVLFLSTLSLRRATSIKPVFSKVNAHFYPRSPCGERHNLLTNVVSSADFYPRSPCGERPAFDVLAVSALLISIHALLAESDSKSAQNSGALLRI